jgi:hypothetical protein
VQYMTAIYQPTERVLIWLRDASRNSNVTLDTLSRLGGIDKQFSVTKSPGTLSAGRTLTHSPAIGPLSIDPSQLPNVYQISRSPRLRNGCRGCSKRTVPLQKNSCLQAPTTPVKGNRPHWKTSSKGGSGGKGYGSSKKKNSICAFESGFNIEKYADSAGLSAIYRGRVLRYEGRSYWGRLKP